MPTTNSTAPAFLHAWPLHTLRWLPWVACAAGLLALGWRMIDGLTLRPFDDEWETILGAQVLGVGGRLHRDFVDIHGPFIFMVSQVYGALFGWDHANSARLIPTVMITLAGAAIGLSPGLRRVARPSSVALFAGGLATVWLRQALYIRPLRAAGASVASR